VEYRSTMNWIERPWVLALSSLLVATPVRADVTEPKDNPYKVILDRNPFGLRDAPPQPDLLATNPPPVKVDVKFTGVTSVGSSKRAWFVIPPLPGRQQPKILSLSEGDSDGDLKVLEIDEKVPTVKVLNAGIPVVLNFKDHGVATPAAAPAFVPHPLPGGVLPAPGLPPPGVRTALATPYVPPTGMTPSGQPPTTTGTGPAPLRTIPARNLRTAPVETQAPVDPAVQYLNLKISEEAARRRGIPYPPTPPIPGMPQGQHE
jgi:hypothetical protein